MRAHTTPAKTTHLFLLEDLADVSRTRELAESDLDALRAVADWIKTFVARPHKDLGRAGPVCPFVPGAWERQTLWLAPEQIADRSVQDVVQRINEYKKLFLHAQPIDGDDANYKAIVVVFTDLSADRAKDFFDDVLQHLGSSILCGRWTRAGRVLREQRGVCDIQPELSTIHSARAVSVSEACGHQRLEVLFGQRGLAQPVGASLWRVGSPGSC